MMTNLEAVFLFLTWFGVCLQKGDGHQLVGCEDTILTLFCRDGNQIHVTYAVYGRTSTDVCKRKKVRDDCTNFEVNKTSMRVVTEWCEGKPTCSLSVVNDVFGDPCKGTYKYLQVRFFCLKADCQAVSLNMRVPCPDSSKSYDENPTSGTACLRNPACCMKFATGDQGQCYQEAILPNPALKVIGNVTDLAATNCQKQDSEGGITMIPQDSSLLKCGSTTAYQATTKQDLTRGFCAVYNSSVDVDGPIVSYTIEAILCRPANETIYGTGIAFNMQDDHNYDFVSRDEINSSCLLGWLLDGRKNIPMNQSTNLDKCLDLSFKKPEIRPYRYEIQVFYNQTAIFQIYFHSATFTSKPFPYHYPFTPKGAALMTNSDRKKDHAFLGIYLKSFISAVAPTTIKAQLAEFNVVQNEFYELVCTTDAVRPGRDVMIIEPVVNGRVIAFTNRTKKDIEDDATADDGGVVRVEASGTVTFNHTHHGERLQCRVHWFPDTPHARYIYGDLSKPIHVDCEPNCNVIRIAASQQITELYINNVLIDYGGNRDEEGTWWIQDAPHIFKFAPFVQVVVVGIQVHDKDTNKGGLFVDSEDLFTLHGEGMGWGCIGHQHNPGWNLTSYMSSELDDVDWPAAGKSKFVPPDDLFDEEVGNYMTNPLAEWIWLSKEEEEFEASYDVVYCRGNRVSMSSPCLSEPCLNDGRCMSTSIKSYTCECTQLFTGAKCETDIQSNAAKGETDFGAVEAGSDAVSEGTVLTCSSVDEPCKNNGTCLDSNTGYTCECLEHTSGADCGIDLRNKTAADKPGLSSVQEEKSNFLTVYIAFGVLAFCGILSFVIAKVMGKTKSTNQDDEQDDEAIEDFDADSDTDEQPNNTAEPQKESEAEISDIEEKPIPRTFPDDLLVPTSKNSVRYEALKLLGYFDGYTAEASTA